jgi:hypothetical protein
MPVMTSLSRPIGRVPFVVGSLFFVMARLDRRSPSQWQPHISTMGVTVGVTLAGQLIPGGQVGAC